MLFGFMNTSGSFQVLINETLVQYLDDIVVAYLDDIVVYSNMLEEHMEHVWNILECFAQADLYIKWEKCEFYKLETTFMGFIVGREGVRMDSGKVAAITSWPTPRTKRELESFLSFTNFYRQFIQSYSRIARSITSLLWGKNKFV
jgi:hypothetical protein